MRLILAFALSAVIFTFGISVPAKAQDTPLDAAKAAGLYGITPDFSAQMGWSGGDAARQAAWDVFGIYFEEYNNVAFVAALKPNGAAAKQGAKVGDVLRGTGSYGASRSLRGILTAVAAGAALPEGKQKVLLYVFDGNSGWQREYTLTGEADGQVVSIPPSLRSLSSYPGFMAILRAEPKDADPWEIAHDAMLSLQAISKHVKECYGPNAVSIPINISVTETTRDGFGTVKNTETSEYGEVLIVRREFADWARSNIRVYPTEPISGIRNAVLKLISTEGCDGAGFKQLEAGLAAVMNVDLPDVGDPSANEDGIPSDPKAFINQCYPLQQQAMAAKGLNMGERGLAQICMCQEHAARTLDNVELYSSLQVADDSVYNANPQLHGAFTEAFDECFRAPDGSEFRQRVEALWREMNI
ncbi:MAG: hypothetical protein AAFN80_11955 [Pseudomonadota bacterium]